MLQACNDLFKQTQLSLVHLCSSQRGSARLRDLLKNKGILNISENHGPVWPAYVWPADDIHLCSIFPYFSIFAYT